MESNAYFGTYEIIGKIAEGAFCDIFKVMKEGDYYALKKLKPYMMFDREYIPLLKTEALLLSKVKDQAHFPILYDHGQINEESFSILELVEGINLEDLIRISFLKKETLSFRLVAKLLLEICRGLEVLHHLDLMGDNPTVHGDLRASNVMVSATGEVKLIDLGLKGGTFDYMPLERLHDRNLTFYTDIYAAGHILYELIHGKRLFGSAKTKLEAYFQMRDLQITDGLFEKVESSEIRKILVKCLRQEPNFHYSEAGEMRADLDEFLRVAGGPVDSKELGKIVKKFMIPQEDISNSCRCL